MSDDKGRETAARAFSWGRWCAIAWLVFVGAWCEWHADGLALGTIPDELTMGEAVHHIKASVYLTGAVVLTYASKGEGPRAQEVSDE